MMLTKMRSLMQRLTSWFISWTTKELGRSSIWQELAHIEVAHGAKLKGHTVLTSRRWSTWETKDTSLVTMPCGMILATSLKRAKRSSQSQSRGNSKKILTTTKPLTMPKTNHRARALQLLLAVVGNMFLLPKCLILIVNAEKSFNRFRECWVRSESCTDADENEECKGSQEARINTKRAPKRQKIDVYFLNRESQY